MFTVTERLCTAVSSSGKVSNATTNGKRHRTRRVTRDGDAVAVGTVAVVGSPVVVLVGSAVGAAVVLCAVVVVVAIVTSAVVAKRGVDCVVLLCSG